MKPTRAQTIISLITATLAAIGGLLFLRRRAPARTNPAAAPAVPPLDVSDEPALQPTPRKQIATPIPLEKELAGEVLSRNPNRALLTVGLLFFAAASLLLIQVGAPGLLFVFCWLMAIILASVLLLAPLPIARPGLRETLAQHAWEVPPLLVLVILAAGMQSATLVPRTALPEHEHIIALTRLTAPTDETGVFYYAASLPDLQRLSAALAVLGILTVYAFARRLGGPYVALFAAGFAAASGWTLALGKSGLAYPALTVFGGLLGLTLLHAWQTGSRRAYGWAGLIVGLGWLFTPLMLWLALFIPLTALLSAIESR
ncbi:MAG: hypothetical protein JNJ61_16900, partial [Anaerolineae bacterium]|nr:hypothetical protein [Anaerolineae bacterium]